MQKKYFYVDSPLFKLECTAKICERHFSRIFKDNFSNLGITQGELCLMDTVVRSPEISQIELARLLFKGRAHITQMLKSLETKGLIQRFDETKKGRKIRKTVLTPQGEEIYNIINEVLEKNFQSMTKFFDGREEGFIHFLDEIKDIITDGAAVDFE